MSAAERITVEHVIDNAEDYADERSTTVEWIIENAEDVADEENARATRPEFRMEDRRPMLVLERADLEIVVTHPWVGVAPLDLTCATCGGYGRHPIQLQSDGLFGSKGKCLDCSDGQIELPVGLATMLLADTTGRIHGTWTGRLLPMVDVTPDPPSAPHIYIRPGDNAVYIWNHPHPLAYMPTESLTGTWAPGGHAIHAGTFTSVSTPGGCPACDGEGCIGGWVAEGGTICWLCHGYHRLDGPFRAPGAPNIPCVTTIDLEELAA
ncbi:MAG TPA: hypothetical protein PKY13_09135 [Microthrixaceae bacterium]|nr:hypothetical protein [Microthrixaceae bacterium]HQF93260.1 hypothetical protein [Microthrixaceae bacterium]